MTEQSKAEFSRAKQTLEMKIVNMVLEEKYVTVKPVKVLYTHTTHNKHMKWPSIERLFKEASPIASLRITLSGPFILQLRPELLAPLMKRS